jgi:thiol:disulfide interchange protein
VLSSDTIRKLVETDKRINSLKADTTISSSEGSAYLQQLGVRGIPLIVVDGPGVPAPLLADTYTVESLLQMIEAARGK